MYKLQKVGQLKQVIYVKFVNSFGIFLEMKNYAKNTYVERMLLILKFSLYE